MKLIVDISEAVYKKAQEAKLEEMDNLYLCCKVANAELFYGRKDVWIPITERYPEEPISADGYVEPSKEVLVTCSNGDVFVSRYWGNRKTEGKIFPKFGAWIDLSSDKQDVIAWMAMPEGYKGGDADGQK